MKKNYNYLYFSIFILAVLIGFYIKLSNLIVTKDDVLLQKIGDIELKINSLQSKKDSIRAVIDSTHVKIITNEKHYQEVVNTIISQPSSADNEYVTDYIRQYSSKNDMSNIR